MATSQIILLALALVVGFFLGALLSWIFSGREKETPSNPEIDKLIKLREQYQERVGLWAERGSGKLVVKMGEQMAADPQQLNESQRRQLQTLMREWLIWMGFPGSTSQQLPAAPAPAPTSASRQAVLVSPDLAAVGAAVPIQPAPAQVNKSIVEQIDEIFQEKLDSSELAGKGVRIAEDVRQGVVVWVGLERYNGVDAVTDPAVKAVLKAAVAEWESRSAHA